MQTSIHSGTEIKTLWKNFNKLLLVVHLSFLHGKQLLMKLLVENQQTYTNLLLGLMLGNYIPTRCVNPCRPVFLRVSISIEKRVYSHLDKTRPAALKKWSCLISNEQDQNVKFKASLQQADRRNLTAPVLMCFVLIAKLCLRPEAMGCFYHFCPCQELRPSLTEEDIQRGSKKRELDALRRHYIQDKGFKVIAMWECEWWRLYKATNTVKEHTREHFPYRRSLATEQLLEEITEGRVFGYLHCDIEVLENLRSKFVNIPPIIQEHLS